MEMTDGQTEQIQRGVQAGCDQSHGAAWQDRHRKRLAEELGVGRKFLYLWRERLQAGGKAALERRQGKAAREQIEISFHSQPSVQLELRIAELERCCC